MALGAQNSQSSRLGRGLASLIGDVPEGRSTLPPEGEQRILGIDQLKPSPFNPRKEFVKEELAELASSIREKGLVQPLIVRPVIGSELEFEIVAGERRWRAAQEAGLQTVPAIVRDLNEQEVLEIAIIENVQRSDLNAIEEAQGYKELTDKYSYTQDDLSRIIGKSRSHLANTMRLLKLPDDVQILVRNGSLSAGHARALVGREDAKNIAREIVERRLNVRDVEALIQKARGASKGKSRIGKSADIRALERELSEELGLVILISPRTGEAGEIRIRYNSLEQFEDIHERLARRG